MSSNYKEELEEMDRLNGMSPVEPEEYFINKE
jgi:hypothetical protein